MTPKSVAETSSRTRKAVVYFTLSLFLPVFFFLSQYQMIESIGG